MAYFIITFDQSVAYMLDQSFSSENFRIIFDIEYRKGINLEYKSAFLDTFKLSRECTDEIKKINANIKDIRKKKNCKKITKKSFYEEKAQYDEEKIKCKDERDVKLTEIFKNSDKLKIFINIYNFSL